MAQPDAGRDAEAAPVSDLARAFAGFEIDPLTLRFRQSGIEAQYDAAVLPQRVLTLRICLALGIVGQFGFVLLDRWVVPDAAGIVQAIRFALALGFAATFAASFLRPVAEHVQAIACFGLLVCAGAVLLIVQLSAAPNAAQYIGEIPLLITALLVIFGIKLYVAVPCALLIVLAAGLVLWRLDHAAGFVLAQLGLMLAFLALGAAGGYMSEYFRRRAWMSDRTTLLERERSERLLLNILPESIAARIKGGADTIADRFDFAGVLFADIVGFTVLADSTPPERLVRILDRIFSGFDQVVDEFRLEKIKTIGDAYMVAAGLPENRPDNLIMLARAALRMQAVLHELRAALGIPIDIRIGLHAGPVVAGVIGRRKFLYDLWGDSVNIASRLESHGEPGKVHVSDVVRTMLRDKFEFEARGRVHLKGKGEIAVG